MARKSSSPGLPSQRQLRAGELVRHAISDILAREDFRDPDLVGVIVTVGEVRCSPDLRHANIFVSPLGNDSEEGRTKLTPQLHFIAVKSYDEATAIDRLLADPRVRRDLDQE